MALQEMGGEKCIPACVLTYPRSHPPSSWAVGYQHLIGECVSRSSAPDMVLPVIRRFIISQRCPLSGVPMRRMGC
jgi:hypothetical protein